MPQFEFHQRSFWLDGKPFVPFGGEFHYFRADPAHWADRLKAMRDLHINLLSTYIPWIWHAPHPDMIDFRGRSHPQRNLIRFIELAHQAGLLVFIRPGPYVMAELRQEGIPAWVSDRYPEVLAQGPGGQPHPTGMVSYLHPTFLQLVKKWYEAVADALRPYFAENGGPIVMTQLDNEVGMLHWVSQLPDQRTDITPELPVAIQAAPGQAAYWQVAEYWSAYRAQYLHTLHDWAEAFGFPRPFVVNVHGFRDFSVYSRGVDYPVGLAQLEKTHRLADTVLGGDFYPGHVTYDNFHDLVLAALFTKAVNQPEAPGFSPEFQSGRFQDRPHIDPSDLDLAARATLAAGFNGINWYMLVGGQNPENIGLFGSRHLWQAPLSEIGDSRPSAAVVGHLGALLATYHLSLPLTRPVAEVTLGFYPPYYLTDTNPDAYPDTTGIVTQIIHQRQQEQFDGVARMLVAGNLVLDAQVVNRPGALGGVEVLFLPVTRYLDRSTQERLVEYVHEGGTLILGPDIPDRDLDGHPVTVLRDGLKLPEPVEEGHRGLISVLDWHSVYAPRYWAFSPQPEAERLAFVEGEPEKWVAFRRGVGRGSVTVLGCGCSDSYDYYHAVMRDLLARLGIPGALSTNNPRLHVTYRQTPSHQAPAGFLFIQNYHDSEENAAIRLYTSQKTYVWEVMLSPRQGLMLPFGGIEVVPGHLAVQSTTAEMTFDGEVLAIHRGPAAGHAQLTRQPGASCDVLLLQGSATVAHHPDAIDIQWSSQSCPRPILLLTRRNVSMT